MVRDQRGMTLIEILTVVVILSVLFFVGMAAFGNNGSGARRSSCKSNLKNIDVAITMYKDSHDGVDPASVDDLVAANLLRNKPEEPHAGYGDYTIVDGRARADQDHQTY